MAHALHTHQLLLMKYPYLVVGAGFDVPTGIPRALKKPSAPLWWQREGEGTAFRLSPRPDSADRYAVSLWWAHHAVNLPDFQQKPHATGHNTVHLKAPSEGTFVICGTDADLFPGMIKFDSTVVRYSWTIYIRRSLPDSTSGAAPQIEVVTLAFD